MRAFGQFGARGNTVLRVTECGQFNVSALCTQHCLMRAFDQFGAVRNAVLRAAGSALKRRRL